MTFTVSAKTTLRPDQLVDEIFNVSNWSGFAGWGPLPGIKEAKVVRHADAVVGTRIAVTNTDGSTHEETVIEFVPARRLVMRIDTFSAPLNRFAECFIETWLFERKGGHTYLERRFDLHPKGRTGKILLKLVAYGLKRAVAAHTHAIAVPRA